MSEKNNPVLAIDNGAQVRTDTWPPRSMFGEEEKKAVVALFDRCIETGEAFGYSGDEEEAFCCEFAEELGGGFADAVNSGTNAVYVALRSMELEPGAEVIVPPISDPGGVMPVALENLIPIPADSATGSYNVGVEQIKTRLTDRTRAIIIAHIAGIPVDMDPILKLATDHNILILEDCAQAHGATYKGKRVGMFGDVAAFSMMFGKHIAMGGQGGIVFTRDEDRYWKIRRMADRGKPFGLKNATGNVVAALNCNTDELHAVIGRVQLKKLGKIVKKRRELAMKIAHGCEKRLQSVRMVGDPVRENSKSAFGDASFWFLFFTIDVTQLSVDKDKFVEAVAAEGIPVGSSYMFCPTMWPWFCEQRVYGNSRLPWSSSLYKGDRNPMYEMSNIEATDASHFRLDFHEGMGDKEISDLLEALAKVENAYLK